MELASIYVVKKKKKDENQEMSQIFQVLYQFSPVRPNHLSLTASYDFDGLPSFALLSTSSASSLSIRLDISSTIAIEFIRRISLRFFS